ncbi:MAG: SpoIIE family protein phosphatase [Candidatus Cybelea sp.]
MVPRVHAPLVFTLVLLLLLIVSLVVGGRLLQTIVTTSFQNAESIRGTRVLAAHVVNEQLDEETGIRGYAAVHQAILLEPYYEGRSSFPSSVTRLRRALQERQQTQALLTLDDAVYVNRRWEEHVAAPSRSTKAGNSYLALHGKWLIDRFRIDMARIDTLLAQEEVRGDARAEAATLWIGIFAAAAVVIVVLATVLFSVQQYALGLRLEGERAALEAEKRIADTLQEAFLQRIFPTLPAVSFSATYLPATEGAKVGGDWYDALQLSADRVLLVIGDVTGHGIEATIAMNRARQLLIGSALLDPNPQRMLERVNLQLVRENGVLITAIAGVIDTRTYEFAYAAAGHPPPVLFEPHRRARLLEFGGMPLGVAAGTVYRTQRLQTVPGAMIVLYTDGLIEHSRDLAAGEAALLKAVEAVATEPQTDAAAAIRDQIFGNREIADDVAILTIRFTDAPSGAARAGSVDDSTFTVGIEAGKLSAPGLSAFWRIA